MENASNLEFLRVGLGFLSLSLFVLTTQLFIIKATFILSQQAPRWLAISLVGSSIFSLLLSLPRLPIFMLSTVLSLEAYGKLIFWLNMVSLVTGFVFALSLLLWAVHWQKHTFS